MQCTDIKGMRENALFIKRNLKAAKDGREKLCMRQIPTNIGDGVSDSMKKDKAPVNRNLSSK